MTHGFGGFAGKQGVEIAFLFVVKHLYVHKQRGTAIFAGLDNFDAEFGQTVNVALNHVTLDHRAHVLGRAGGCAPHHCAGCHQGAGLQESAFACVGHIAPRQSESGPFSRAAAVILHVGSGQRSGSAQAAKLATSQTPSG